MIDKELNTKNNTENIKLHSNKAISGATFLGGPLAAGYLISENFKALNKPVEGKKSLIIGIISTLLLFWGVFMIPEKILNRIPSQVIPLIYTGVIWGIVEWKQGAILKSHKENGNSFFSGWKAAGVGFVSLLIIGAGLFAYVYMESNNPAFKIYESKISKFSKNETESLTFYNNLDVKDKTTLLTELDNNVIPKWEENIRLIKELNNVKDLTPELIEQNKTLLKYSELRLESFTIIKKAISEETDVYDNQINILNMKINTELDKLE